ncbi:MAG: DUF2207 domain-containing protein [Chloroflexi bacterium]|nr:DUF2207 domain-containing protein [Chloroflexota bacterium]
MGSALVAVAILAAIVVLFVLDPGGVIAESGFPDVRAMDRGQLAAWGFRTLGVVVAQLIIIALWLWPGYRPPRPLPSAAPQPGSMPAAAVSALEGHMIWRPTMLASIVEMCQRGTLHIEAVRTRAGFMYRLTRQGPTEFEWERTICDTLPSRPTTIDALHDGIARRWDTIGDQIGDYLQQRGLFDGNPVRVRRENDGDHAKWRLLAAALMGVGTGLWAALWLDQWWWQGVLVFLVYLGIPTPVRTGMLTPTPVGANEMGRWFGWMESMVRSEQIGARDQADPMLPYAIALGVAEPWLDATTSAPPWFGSGGAAPLQGADLDAAYQAFMHSLWWDVPGRSDDAAKGAAEGPIEEARGAGCLRGCVVRIVGIAGAGVLVVVVLFSHDVVSPRAKPCPLNSPPIPTAPQIAVAGDLFRDQCVSVRGTLVSRDADELVLEMDRGEFLQRVTVHDPSEVLGALRLGGVVTLAGWLRVEEDGTYAVEFIPDRGSDREWWRNLRENLEALF